MFNGLGSAGTYRNISLKGATMKKRVISTKYLMVVITLLVFSAGCFATSDRYANVQKSRMKYKKIAVATFTVSRDGVAEDDPKRVRKHLHTTGEECVSVLKDSRLFEKVTIDAPPTSADATLIVQGELLEMRIVGTATRDWIGWTAGKSGMSIHIKLVDARTGALVAEQRFRGYAGGSNIADADLTSLIGQQIGEFVIHTTTQQARTSVY
jgi:hypothetical protein